DEPLKRVGLTGLDLANAMRGKQGLIGAVSLLKEHLDHSGMSAAEASQLLSRAFGGGRSSSAILTMLNNLDVLKQKQDQINHSIGRFPEAVRAQRRTAEAQWKLLVSSIQVIGVKAGTALLPPVTAFVRFIANTAIPTVGRFGHALVTRFVPVDAIRKDFHAAEKTVGDFLDGLLGRSSKRARKKKHKIPFPELEGFIKPTPKKKPQVPFPEAEGIIKSTPKHVSAATRMGKNIRDAVAGGIGKADWSKLGRILGHGIGSSFQ